VTDEVAICPSKRMRNKIAGFMTHLMRRIERGDQVRGISLKLQEEERERRMDFVPEVSAINTDAITVDPETKALLDTLALPFAAGVTVQQPQRTDFKPRRDGPVGGAPRS
jgi:small subunit ribosomal protein S17e